MRQDRTVVITGATGGIGSALVDRFIGNGDTVVGVDLNAEHLDALRAARGDDPRLVTAVADISDEDACLRVADKARGRVDVLINCAGYFPTKAFDEMTAAEWRRVIDINLTGTFLMSKAMLPLMKSNGWGRIVNIGSATFFRGSPNQAHYVASKGGVIGLSRCMATELAAFGITVNVVTPGLTVTDAVQRDFPAALIDKTREDRPIKRDMHAGDIIGAIFFLTSPDAEFITGQIVNVDGGMVKH